MHHHVVFLAELPDGVVLRVVVGVAVTHQGGNKNPFQAIFMRPPAFRQGLIHIVQHQHNRQADTAHRVFLAELGDPTIVRTGSRPLQLGVDAPGPQR